MALKVELKVNISEQLDEDLKNISLNTEISLDDLVTDLLKLALVDRRCGPWIKGRYSYLMGGASRTEERARALHAGPIASSPGLMLDVKPETKGGEK